MSLFITKTNQKDQNKIKYISDISHNLLVENVATLGTIRVHIYVNQG